MTVCPVCNGSGRPPADVPSTTDLCDRCAGTGEVADSKENQ